ncbi:hypothetical protein ACN20G_06635 [Streptomyces sp. BI20]|uniref:hypothetical protein n=1 Tax=Streptomyces sp. BI20 TaxID=3403460 RepID=UPI003C74682B
MISVRRSSARAGALALCTGVVLLLAPASAALADPAATAGSADAKAGSPTAPRLLKTVSLADGVTLAKVYRTGSGGYRAEILAGGSVLATLATPPTPGAGAGSGARVPSRISVGELRIALRTDGRISSWMGAEDSAAGASARPVALGPGADGFKTARRTGAHGVPGAVPASAPAGAAVSASPAGPAAGDGGGRVVGIEARDRARREATDALRLDNLAAGRHGDGVLLLAAGGGIAAVGAAGLGFAMLRRGRSAG